MSMNNFECIMPGCSNRYETEEMEAYYCESCQLHKKNVAAQIDAQFKNRPTDTKSDLQIFEEQAKQMTSPDGRKMFLMRG